MESETQKLEEEFHVSRYIIIYKFVLGLLEFLLGASIIFGRFESNELLEDFVPYLFKHRQYIIITLVILGLAKMIAAIGLAYKKMWALDLLLGVTILILPFQLIAFMKSHSVFDFIYFAIGVFIVFWLVNFKPKQYLKKIKKRISKHQSQLE